MRDNDLTPDELGTLFASARMPVAPIEDEFLKRLQDHAVQAAPVSDHKVRPASLWQQLHALLGGWSGFGRLGLAGIMGFALGISGSLGAMDTLYQSAFLQNDLEYYAEQFSSVDLDTLFLEDL
jgi:hypothetical protein